jgi:hypothetical protein
MSWRDACHFSAVVWFAILQAPLDWLRLFSERPETWVTDRTEKRGTPPAGLEGRVDAVEGPVRL